jgi:hypothetical protein
MTSEARTAAGSVRDRPRGHWLEAEDCVRGGDLLAAMDVLTAANRLHADSTRERRLVELRHLAVSQLDGERGRTTWPPEFPDPFPSARLPEVGAEDVTVERVGGGILHHGAVLVRGLIPPSGVERLVYCIDRSLQGVAAKRAGTSTEADAEWFTPFGRRGMAIGEGTEWVRVIDSPRSTFEVAEQLDEIGRSFVTEYLGQRPVLGAYKWTLRRITPECVGEWHQDGRVLGAHVRVVNVWIALNRCGGAEPAPGLEVVPGRLDSFLASGTDDAALDFGISGKVLGEHGLDGIANPVYEPGDALIFDERTAHRTGSRDGLSSSRYAIEAWFFSPSAYPADQMLFVF